MADGESNKGFEKEPEEEARIELRDDGTAGVSGQGENQQGETSLSLEGEERDGNIGGSFISGSDTPSAARYKSDDSLGAGNESNDPGGQPRGGNRTTPPSVSDTPSPAQYDSDTSPESGDRSNGPGEQPRDGNRTTPLSRPITRENTTNTPSRPTTRVSHARAKIITVQEGKPQDAEWETQWDQSPYTYKGLASRLNAISPRMHSVMTPQAVTVEFGRGDGRNGTSADPEGRSGDGDLRMVPPTGHFGDFYTPDELGEREFNQEDSDSDDDGFHLGYFQEEEVSINDKSTMFGQLRQQLGPEVPINTGTTRKQARNGLKLAQHIGKVPLSKVWHTFSEIFVLCIFFTNVIVGIYDIVRGPEFLYYKVTAVVFGVLENLILLSMWFVVRHPRFKKSDDYKLHLKRMQYAENITAEILMYVTIIITLFGFSTEKMYQNPGDAFGWTQLVLLILDVIELLYTNVLRLYMLYRLMTDLKGVFEPDEKPGCCSYGTRKFAGGLIPRAYATVVGNLLLLLLIAGMLGVQVWKDNFTSEDYHATLNSGLLLVLLILIPILGNALFVLINAYWIIELLLKLNTKVGQSKDHIESLGEKYGETVAGALEFAQEKFSASAEKLAAIDATKTWQKTLYGLGEIPILLLIFFYEVMCFLALYFFNGFDEAWLNIFVKVLFVVVMIAANYHLCLLMFLSNFAVLILFVSVFIYPLTVPLCCRQKSSIVDEYKRFKGNALKIK